MSGPIIRKYGFANFDKIFGERELKHGVESTSTSPTDQKPADLSKPSQDSEPAKVETPPSKS